MANTKRSNVHKFDTETMQHIVRLYNTNIDGTKKIQLSLTKIKGIGSQFANAVIAQCGITKNKFAGELSQEDINRIVDCINNPTKFGIPDYYLNHRNDITTGETSHLVGNKMHAVHRKMLETGKKFNEVRRVRLALGLKCRGQHTCSNGRRQKRFANKNK